MEGEEPFRIVARGRKAKTFAEAVVKGPGNLLVWLYTSNNHGKWYLTFPFLVIQIKLLFKPSSIRTEVPSLNRDIRSFKLTQISIVIQKKLTN